MSQRAQMAEDDVFALKRKEGVFSSELARCFVAKGWKTKNRNASHIVLARTVEKVCFFGEVAILFA